VRHVSAQTVFQTMWPSLATGLQKLFRVMADKMLAVERALLVVVGIA